MKSLEPNSRHGAGATVHNSGAPLIQLRNVTKIFKTGGRETSVLKGIDLLIKSGEFVAIKGKSGSGKSTLLNMLTGIDHPTEGNVVINSTSVHILNESRLARWRGQNIGIVFQFFQLIPTLSILENMILAMDFVNVIPREDREKRARELLTEVDILDHADKLPASLSGGEQQRAAIARALANDPPILVADEPTGNLDSLTAKAIQEVFVRLAAKGKTVIVVTHDDLANFQCQRAITINDGRIVRDETIPSRK
ncbi:MAG: ABC transporter ATP-binding protein [Candidatus Zixiibacteriota bacterium]